jgi:hypothetical protein
VIVAVAGLLVTVLLLSFGTYVAVRNTSSGKMVSGQSQMPPDPWKAVESWHNATLLYVVLPTVVIVGYLVGAFAKRYTLLAAVVATSPVFILSFSWAPRDVLVTAALLICAIGAAYVSIWRRSRSEAQSAGQSS